MYERLFSKFTFLAIEPVPVIFHKNKVPSDRKIKKQNIRYLWFLFFNFVNGNNSIGNIAPLHNAPTIEHNDSNVISFL